MTVPVKPLATLILAVLATLATVGCKKPAPGGPCSEAGKIVCQDPGSALICKEGTFVPIPCHGANGCKQSGTTAHCDDRLAIEGDACQGGPAETYACSTDNKKALVCRDGRYHLWRQCRGPNACSIQGATVDCDTSLSEAGDPCGQPGSFTCSVDRKWMFTCKDDHLEAASSCRGPKECVTNAATKKVECDDSVALEGDACNHQDGESCSVDSKAMLVCKDHQYVQKRACKRKGGCVVKNGEIYCDF
jgi:hypothetical protein